jgi:putative ABC transport system permease protein
MWRATLKSLLARKLRLLLTAFAVVLGVGFMAGTLVITDTALSSFDQLFGNVFTGTDVVVQAKTAFTADQGGPGGGGGSERNPIPADLLPKVRAVPGVRAADGDVAGLAQIVDPATGDVIANGGAPTIGNSWDPDVTTLQVSQGSPPSGPGQVSVDAATARDHSLSVGETVRVVTSTGSGRFTISGIVKFGTSDSLLGATLAVFDLPTAQQLFDRPNEFDFIYVAGDGSLSATQLAQRITTVLPGGYQAITGASAAQQQTDQVDQGLGFLRTGLLVFAFVALFVGAFLIFNTFNIVVTQRTRELALLRALGASRRQVTRSVLLESAIVGLVTSAIGVIVGLGLAVVLKGVLSAIGLKLPATSLVLKPRTVIVSLIVGTLITVAAATSPARRASRVAPVEALRESIAPGSSFRRRAIVGSLVTAIGVGALAAGLFGSVSNGAALVGVGDVHVHRGRRALAADRATAGRRDREAVPRQGLRSPRKRECDPQPAQDRRDGRRADDRPRPGDVRGGLRRLAESIGVGDPRRRAPCRPDPQLDAVHSLHDEDRGGPRVQPHLPSRVAAPPGRDQGEGEPGVRRGDRPGHDRSGGERHDGRRVALGAVGARHGGRVADGRRLEGLRGRG